MFKRNFLTGMNWKILSTYDEHEPKIDGQVCSVRVEPVCLLTWLPNPHAAGAVSGRCARDAKEEEVRGGAGGSCLPDSGRVRRV
eukprot:2776173-Pyramimonas_sp.AAC.1